MQMNTQPNLNYKLNDLRLSIILPVYNVGPYIERCINSLLDQNMQEKDFEIIVINDGSQDDSREIVVKMMQKCSNIVLIDQSNQGVSSARNAGIEVAKGKYLLFMDPDDYASSQTLSNAVTLAEKKGVEVLYLGFRCVSAEDLVLGEVAYSYYVNDTYEGPSAYFISRGNGKIDPDRTWGILFQNSFIDNHQLRYLPNIPYLEDGEFIARAMCLAKKCAFSDSKLYIRTVRPGSATSSRLFSEKRSILGFIRAAANLREFRSELSESNLRRFMNQPIAKFVLLSIKACSTRSSVRHFCWTVRMLRQFDLVELQLEQCTSPYRYYGVIYNASPFFFLLFYLFKNAFYLSHRIWDTK